MKTSDNLNLNLPESSDYADIAVLTDDLKKLDAAQPGANTKTAPAAADSVLLYDSADATPGKPKKTLLSALTTFFSTALSSVFAAASHAHAWSAITDKPTVFSPASHSHAASDISSGTLPVVRGGTGGGDATTARSNLGAATAPTLATVTFPASGWVLNSTTACYEQTADAAGLLTTDTTATVTVMPKGSTDAAAQLLTDEAYGCIFTKGSYAACNTAGKLYVRGPSGGDKPTVDFPVYVVLHR